MTGVHVVEVAAWVAAPAAGAILADWGAEVIKIEPFGGDPFRGMVAMGPTGLNPVFELDNRGKRSVALDIATPDGRRLLFELVERADVFITNLRPSALEQLGIDPTPCSNGSRRSCTPASPDSDTTRRIATGRASTWAGIGLVRARRRPTPSPEGRHPSSGAVTATT